MNASPDHHSPGAAFRSTLPWMLGIGVAGCYIGHVALGMGAPAAMAPVISAFEFLLVALVLQMPRRAPGSAAIRLNIV